MGLLAYVFIALALLPQVTQQSDTITWVFTTPSCGGCQGNQLSLMKDYYKSGDIIVINEKGSPEEFIALQKSIRKTFPSAKLTKGVAGQPSWSIDTGFLWVDTFTLESLSYSARKGTYNISRALVILQTFR